MWREVKEVGSVLLIILLAISVSIVIGGFFAVLV